MSEWITGGTFAMMLIAEGINSGTFERDDDRVLSETIRR
jgi:hypothetical protein